MACLHQVRGGAVDLAHSAPPRTGNHIGREAAAVRHVDHVNLLAGKNIGGVKQIGVDRYRSDVMQIRTRDGDAMDLAGHHSAHTQFSHEVQPPYCR